MHLKTRNSNVGIGIHALSARCLPAPLHSGVAICGFLIFSGWMGSVHADDRAGLQKFSAEPVVLKAASQEATFDAEIGRITISSRQGEQLKKRAELSFESVKHFQGYKNVRQGNPPRHGIEIYSDSAVVEFSVFVDDQGVFEFKPGKAQKLAFHGLKLRYGMVPGLIGTDFLYDAKTGRGTDRFCIPALSMVLGLVDGEDCMLVGVWPPGRQSAEFELGTGGEPNLIDSLTFDTAGQSFYFSCLEKPGIWHAEPLKKNYLEKETVIAWKRPFEAKWIGRFFITSDEYDWPFYFNSKPARIWGRYIRGWYKYPVRFDGDKTVVHFEKQFLPKGDLLIYCLEPYPTNPASSILTPVEVMQHALGKEETDKILDPEGTVEQTLLEHRLAVCAMTNTMQKWFDEGKEIEHREQIVRWCNDVAAFIRLIRQRDQDFAVFARDMKATLIAKAKEQPKLVGSIAELQEALASIDDTAQRELPTTDLDTVQHWTEEMRKAVDEARPANKRTYGKLAGQCRSVAGTQDDLARDLSVQVIRLTEQAARIAEQSPEHASLAAEVILKARQVLRKPTWWEPTRRFVPKSDPGNTF